MVLNVTISKYQNCQQVGQEEGSGGPQPWGLVNTGTGENTARKIWDT